MSRLHRLFAAFFILVLSLRCPAWADAPAPLATPMERYVAVALQECKRVEARIPHLTELAELVARRHAAGGRLGVIWEPASPTGPQGTQYELKGRSGGLGAFDGNLKKELPDSAREKDVAIMGWQRAPGPEDLDVLKRYREKFFVIALGPRELPALAEHVKLADAWIDTGTGADDSSVVVRSGMRTGRRNALINVLNSWTLMGEIVAALTRLGKMPTILRSHAWPDSKEWNGKYRGKMLFHNDLTVQPVPAGTLSRAYLARIRLLINRFGATQQPAVTRAAELIAAELAAGRKTVVAQSGHTVYDHVGKYEDRIWAIPEVFHNTPGRLREWPQKTPEGALVLRVGYSGEEKILLDALQQHKQRVLMITSMDDKRPDFAVPAELPAIIDMGWSFGDAEVTLEAYPIRLFPPSGVMQLVAYESVNVEVLDRIPVVAAG